MRFAQGKTDRDGGELCPKRAYEFNFKLVIVLFLETQSWSLAKRPKRNPCASMLLLSNSGSGMAMQGYMIEGLCCGESSTELAQAAGIRHLGFIDIQTRP